MSCSWLTSEVLDKVLQLHLALRLDIGAVHVCVEQNDGEGQDEDSVWVPELPYHSRVADTVPLAGRTGSWLGSPKPCTGTVLTPASPTLIPLRLLTARERQLPGIQVLL